mgnify:CR=1 FL=1
MNEHDYDELVAALERIRAERASNQQDARQLLRDEGVIDENGDLTERYGGSAPELPLIA